MTAEELENEYMENGRLYMGGVKSFATYVVDVVLPRIGKDLYEKIGERSKSNESDLTDEDEAYNRGLWEAQQEVFDALPYKTG